MRLFLMMLATSFLLLMTLEVSARQLYRWTDETGKVWIVDDLDRVPEKYRKRVRVYRVPPRGEEESRSQERRIPVFQREVLPIQGEAGGEPSALGQVRTRIKALLEEKAKLQQARTEQWRLRRRFGRTGARATFYKRRARELDEKIGVIQRELDKLLSTGSPP